MGAHEENARPLDRFETYALLDEDSTTTLIERHVALKIAPPGRSETLRIEGVVKKDIIESRASQKPSFLYEDAFATNFDSKTISTEFSYYPQRRFFQCYTMVY
ncbi:hypothetical protein EVAR_60638_1 [Eumeta japonica]|uniref:Uncharacterized protein n=1 Tax=Eumeta variegata TaxID=151549 RepID=A0A4C1ZN18_EUMVA|nr:hypothetical protein EVAR_60638_1 [Eumeta japonica]